MEERWRWRRGGGWLHIPRTEVDNQHSGKGWICTLYLYTIHPAAYHQLVKNTVAYLLQASPPLCFEAGRKNTYTFRIVQKT